MADEEKIGISAKKGSKFESYWIFKSSKFPICFLRIDLFFFRVLSD